MGNRAIRAHAGTVCVIPAYNEAGTIASVVEQALHNAGSVIVVDDGSVDATSSAAGALGARVLRHDRNTGKGAALATGMRAALTAGAHRIVTLDADGQHSPQDIARLLEAARDYPQRIIVGARMRGRANAPKLRRFANRFADFWISWAAGRRVNDTQSGFRLYPAAVAHAVIDGTGTRHGFVFESEALIEAAWRGFSIAHVEIDTVYLAGARPSHYRAVRDTAHIVRMVAGRLLSRCLYPRGLLRSLAPGSTVYVPEAGDASGRAQPPRNSRRSRGAATQSRIPSLSDAE